MRSYVIFLVCITVFSSYGKLLTASPNSAIMGVLERDIRVHVNTQKMTPESCLTRLIKFKRTEVAPERQIVILNQVARFSSLEVVGFDYVVLVIMAVESAFDSAALSPKKARGLMQLTPIAVKEINRIVSYYNSILESRKFLPSTLRQRYEGYVDRCSGLTWQRTRIMEENIRGGMCYLSLLKWNTTSWVATSAAYNGGPSQIERLQQDRHLNTETANYVSKVLFLQETLCN